MLINSENMEVGFFLLLFLGKVEREDFRMHERGRRGRN